MADWTDIVGPPISAHLTGQFSRPNREPQTLAEFDSVEALEVKQADWIRNCGTAVMLGGSVLLFLWLRNHRTNQKRAKN